MGIHIPGLPPRFCSPDPPPSSKAARGHWKWNSPWQFAGGCKRTRAVLEAHLVVSTWTSSAVSEASVLREQQKTTAAAWKSALTRTYQGRGLRCCVVGKMAGRHGMQILTLGIQAFLAILLLGVFVTTEGGEINTITVVLQSDTTLDRDTAISISGLRGAIVEDHDNVPLQGLNDELFSNGGCGTGFQSRAIWRETGDAGEPLHALVVWPLDPLNENTQYSFSFQVRNPEEEQMPTPGGTLDVTIESSGGVGIAR
eukprot:3206543-Rhodomonas_salina.1